MLHLVFITNLSVNKTYLFVVLISLQVSYNRFDRGNHKVLRNTKQFSIYRETFETLQGLK